MATIDLKDAYFHIDILPKHRKFLRFAVSHTHLQDKSLPFGLSAAPRVFTKMMVVIAAHLRLIFPYIDDWLIVAHTEKDLQANLQTTLDLLTRLGLQVNYKKSSLTPSQRVQFIGAILDSRTGRRHSIVSQQAALTVTIAGASNSTSSWTHGFHNVGAALCTSPHETAATLVCQALPPSVPVPACPTFTTTGGEELLTLVDTSHKPLPGTFFLPSRSRCLSHDRRLSDRLGGAYERLLSRGRMVPERQTTTHKCSGAFSYFSGRNIVPPATTGQGSSDPYGQFYGSLLHKSTRRHCISNPLPSGTADVVLVPNLRDIPGSDTCPRSPKRLGRRPQSRTHTAPRLGAELDISQTAFPSLGTPRHRCFRVPQQYQMQEVLLQRGGGSELPRGRSPPLMETQTSVPLSSRSTTHSSSAQTASRAAEGDPSHAMVAEAELATHPPSIHGECLLSTPPRTRSSLSSRGQDPAPQYPPLKVDCLEASLANFLDRIQHVLSNSRKQSTTKSYAYKWKRFLCAVSPDNSSPGSIEFQQVLSYLLSLAEKGLSHSSIRVHLSAISAHLDRVEGFSVFSHPDSKRFLKGLRHLFPPVKLPVPTWDLPLVLRALMRRPFEPMATCPLHLLSWKTFFLVAITSARRVGELVISPLLLCV